MNIPADNIWFWLAGAAAAGLLLAILVAGVFAMIRNSQLRTRNGFLESQLKSQEALREEREEALKHAEQRLATKTAEHADQSLRSHSESFLRMAQESLGKHHERAKGQLGEKEKAIEALVKPVWDALRKTEEQLQQMEKERSEAYGSIRKELETVGRGQDRLKAETQNLVNALRRPEVRGQWGELTLRRVVELAGMVERCDFTEQHSLSGDDGRMRPDMVIHMPEGRSLVVDVKTPLDAYLEAMSARDDAARDAALLRHGRHVRKRIDELSAKAYWSQFDNSPEFVILFVPGEQFLSAALDHDPSLHEKAIEKKVLLTTPTSLVALLKVVAFGWRQMSLADNAERIRDLGQDLYGRLAVFTGHLAKIGRQLGGSVEAYNSAVGSLESKVLPGAKKFVELGIQSKKEMADVDPLDKTTRQVQALPDDVSGSLESDKH